MDYEKIIVTPAGRKRYLKVLLNNLIKCIDEFDEWHLWVNTTEIDPFFALSCHENFFKKYENNNIDNYYTNNWILYDYNRFSINVISWLGKTFLEFNGEVGIDEEEWLSYKPMQLKRPNVIFGKSLFSNYSFFTQREYLDKTNILSKV